MAIAAESPIISDPGRRYLRLQRVEGVGPIRAKKLVDHFGGIDAVFSASVRQLERVEGVGTKTAESMARSKITDEVEAEIERAARHGIRILCLEDPDYPRPLLHIPDPPICLYLKGSLVPTDSVAVAIVGTRRCSHYGREQALRFGEVLASAGFTVISGFARGVDGAAHQGALRAGGRTIAVMGNGLGTIYPPEHAELADKVIEQGALVSELGVDFAPESKNFPSRNRIIVGLSLGVLVIEAGQRSGALISARLASEYNREVFALPGRVDHPEQTAGVNGLIRDGGAKLVTCLEDILDELGEVGKTMRQSATNSKTSNLFETAGAEPAKAIDLSTPVGSLKDPERTVFETIRNGGGEMDAIAASVSLDPGQLGSALTALELKGLVRRLPGDRYEVRTTVARS